MKIAVPCECDDEEHDVDVSAEAGGYGVRVQIGLYAPAVGDALPCGRLINEKDVEHIIDRLEHWGDDE